MVDVLGRRVRPHHEEAPVTGGRDVGRLELRRSTRRAHGERAAHGAEGAVDAPGVDAAGRAVRLRPFDPHDEEVAPGQRTHGGGAPPPWRLLGPGDERLVGPRSPVAGEGATEDAMGAQPCHQVRAVLLDRDVRVGAARRRRVAHPEVATGGHLGRGRAEGAGQREGQSRQVERTTAVRFVRSPWVRTHTEHPGTRSRAQPSRPRPVGLSRACCRAIASAASTGCPFGARAGLEGAGRANRARRGAARPPRPQRVSVAWGRRVA